MFGVVTQSDPAGVVEVVNEAVGELPLIVPILLVVMILSGAVLLVWKLKSNSEGPGWALRDDSKGPRRD